jgi:UDP-glucose 4-epimerase
MKGKKTLVIGGSGFLGSTIIKKLGKEAVIADYSKPINNLENRFLNLNLLDSNKVHEIVKEFDVIINCVGQVTFPINDCLKLNTLGVYNLVNALNQLTKIKLFHISTVAVYGSAKSVKESSPLNPETPYASNKAFAEFIISNMNIHKFCIIRIPNVYGEGQKKGVFAYFRKSFLTDKKLIFEHNGDLLRYYLHVEDVADAIICAVTNNLKGIFNLTSSDRFTIRDLINLIEKIHNMKFELSYGINKSLENIEYLDGNLFREVTNFSPLKKVEDYIKLF